MSEKIEDKLVLMSILRLFVSFFCGYCFFTHTILCNKNTNVYIYTMYITVV